MNVNQISITPEIYNRTFVAGSVTNPDDAEVIFLLAEHVTSYPSDRQKYQEIFNRKVIDNCYNNGDYIWLEERSDIDPEELLKHQEKILPPKHYILSGWDDPEVCKSVNDFFKEVECCTQREKTRRKIEFILKTFSKRQSYLIERILEGVKKLRLEQSNTMEKRKIKIFIFSGPSHGELEDERVRSEVLRLRNSLVAEGINYLMLNGAKLYKDPQKEFEEQNRAKTALNATQPKLAGFDFLRLIAAKVEALFE